MLIYQSLHPICHEQQNICDTTIHLQDVCLKSNQRGCSGTHLLDWRALGVQGALRRERGESSAAASKVITS